MPYVLTVLEYFVYAIRICTHISLKAIKMSSPIIPVGFTNSSWCIDDTPKNVDWAYYPSEDSFPRFGTNLFSPLFFIIIIFFFFFFFFIIFFFLFFICFFFFFKKNYLFFCFLFLTQMSTLNQKRNMPT